MPSIVHPLMASNCPLVKQLGKAANCEGGSVMVHLWCICVDPQCSICALVLMQNKNLACMRNVRSEISCMHNVCGKNQ